MKHTYSTEEWQRKNKCKRYGTPPQCLNPADIRFVGYWEGAFYVSEFEFKHPGDMLYLERPGLTWIGAPGWFGYECCREIYNWLAARYDMTRWHSGEWMSVEDAQKEIVIQVSESKAAVAV